jgi:hypothetical protein
MRSRLAVSLLVGTVTWTWVACSGDDLTDPPPPGQIRVTTVTTGVELDPDGYTVRLDTSPERLIADNESVVLTADPGEHAVELGGVAPNCAVTGPARLEVTVVSEQVTEVSFAVTCAPTVGGLVITTITAGPLPDPDGYTVSVDGGPAQPIAASGSVTVQGLLPGTHEVVLDGIAGNCEAEGDNPVVVEIAGGDPAAVEFRVTCRVGVEQWTPMESGTSADLTEVWSAGDGGAVAVGERDTNRGVEGVFLSRDGDTWTRQFRGDDLRPRGLWGSAPDDLYAAGRTLLATRGWMLHYDGIEWAEVPFPAGELTGVGFESIWGSASDDIFAVGFDGNGVLGTALIYHYDGVGWSRMGVAGDVNPSLTDVWGISPTEVYATGRDNFADPARGAILRYDGMQWFSVLSVENLVLNAVWGSSSSDVYAVGFQVEEQGDEQTVTGAIWHFDGNRWSAVTHPQVGILDDVWGSSASDVYVVGEEGLVLHYDGTAWTVTTLTRENLLAVFGGLPGEVLAVGTGGTILRGTP